MRTIVFRVLAVVVGAVFLLAACDDGASEAVGTAPVFSHDEFRRRVLETEPKGVSIRLELAFGELLGDEPATVEAEIATVPSPATRVLVRFGGRTELLIEAIATSDDLYLRGGFGGAPGEWMKTSLDGGGGIGQTLGVELFSYELLSGRQWTYVGDEDCAAGRCFVVRSDDDDGLQLHLRMTDYEPVLIHQPSISESSDESLTIDVIAWDEQVDVQPPAGGVREVTAQELEAAMIGLLFTLGMGGG